MKKQFLSIILLLGITIPSWAGIDMQAHVASDEGRAAYTDYQAKQAAYYTGEYVYTTLMGQTGETLFCSLNTLMGNTSRIGSSSFTYNTLRYQYVNVDKDLNATGKIIGYYDGRQMDGAWGSGYNREHTWPQSKGADKSTPMGHDMQSVRPTSTAVNSDRGNDAYGESGSYYDPDDVTINNANYKKINLGSYRGDCARVILYDYITYGQDGSCKNGLYLGNAQLFNKLGSSGVFESLAVLLKWHMQDPPSLTEMVRNDGGQTYQGNRNPFIDYPELAINLLKDESGVTAYSVNTTTTATVAPHFTWTTSAGFICYLTFADGTHPQAANLNVKGATYTYDAALGRLTISSAKSAVSIETINDPEIVAINTVPLPDVVCYTVGKNAVQIAHLPSQAHVTVFDCTGRLVEQRTAVTETETFALSNGLYLVRIQANGEQRTLKIVL